ncbi:acyltransferase [Bradyrhizobium liaoningense]|uniref:acyltransferase family protein n=1 Tax=Bradyrhizobium liaoningense TaxID=43992 RepID=UPI001BA49A75|nr:acyltransferase [Bradyrhizobium liaoningense]MBR0903930.1 acyltransferase [Bradyrhizobium liaoningense]
MSLQSADSITTADSRAHKIGAINGLRGLAIMMVILFHLLVPFTSTAPAFPGELDPNGFLAIVAKHGFLGVNIFFVLSGFVLYLPYRTKKRAINRLADFTHFYWHRAARLLPLYYTVVLVTVALHAKSPAGSHAWYLELGGLLSTLFIFVPHGFMPPSNPVLWSVGVEIWFSLLFPLLILLIARFGLRRLLLLSVVICSTFVTAGHLIAVDRIGLFRPFVGGIFGSCYQFIFGMLVCDLYVKSRYSVSLRRFQSRGLLPGLLLMIAAIYLKDNGPWPVSIHYATIFCAGFSMVLLAVLCGAWSANRLFEAWALQVVGCMCYSIYAWHSIIMVEMIPPDTSPLQDTLRLSFPYLAITILLSALSYRYIEFGHRGDWRSLFLLRTPNLDELSDTEVSRHAESKPVASS